MNAESQEFTCTILGSFRFIEQINLVRTRFESVGVTVLAPKAGNIVREVDGFKILDTNRDKTPLEIERDFLACLFNSHFAYLVNPGGYVGFNTCSEMGVALSSGVPLIAMEPLDPKLDQAPTWKDFCQSITSRRIDDLVNFLKDPVSKLARRVEYESHRQSRQPKIEEGIKRAMTHAKMVLLDLNSLDSGIWHWGIETEEPAKITNEILMKNLQNEYEKLGRPVEIYIAGLGTTVTWSPETGFFINSLVEGHIPDPPGVRTWGKIDFDTKH
ncbi:MAG: hypothetical protein Q7R49_07355 [Candidatus Daviesbacteria bacterium]|nr:hypothetical protein [Candidatus Daviesbacteria bacterium]